MIITYKFAYRPNKITSGKKLVPNKIYSAFHSLSILSKPAYEASRAARNGKNSNIDKKYNKKANQSTD
jgi:hypothetical protein